MLISFKTWDSFYSISSYLSASNCIFQNKNITLSLTEKVSLLSSFLKSLVWVKIIWKLSNTVLYYPNESLKSTEDKFNFSFSFLIIYNFSSGISWCSFKNIILCFKYLYLFNYHFIKECEVKIIDITILIDVTITFMCIIIE